MQPILGSLMVGTMKVDITNVDEWGGLRMEHLDMVAW